MSEGDIDAMLESVAREEQDALDRQQGQFILDVMAAEERRKQAGDPLLAAINQAHRARAEADRR
jgi:hypothetical protein